MPKILLTGANGFVGSHFLNLALDRSWEIVTATRKSFKREGTANFTVGDIDGGTLWPDEAFAGVTAVVHLAARVHVMNDDAADPLAEYRRVNVAGTETLARAAVRHGVRRFVYVSSIKVNGEGSLDDHSLIYTENSPPSPADPYGVSKWEAEQILSTLSRETGLETAVIRPPLVYGPGVGANFLKLLKLVGMRLPLPLGSVKNRRALVYVGNLADALATLVTHPRAAGQTYLINDGENVSTPELIGAMARALGVKVFLPPFPVALLKLGAALTGTRGLLERLAGTLATDSTKLKREMDWIPPHTLLQGLEKTVAWYRSAAQK